MTPNEGVINYDAEQLIRGKTFNHVVVVFTWRDRRLFLIVMVRNGNHLA